MPNHVLNEIIFRGVDVARQNAILAKCCNEKDEVDFEILIPTPIHLWLGNVGQKHEKAFGLTALDWSRPNWGTKWNAYSHKPVERSNDTLIFCFQTAWRPPYPWLVAIFNTFKLSFDHNWLDEGAERGVSGKWRHEFLGDLGGDPWTEEPADDDMQKHLHKLKWGVESFDDEGSGDRTNASGDSTGV